MFLREVFGNSMSLKGYFAENLSPKIEIDDDGYIYELHTDLVNNAYNVPGVGYTVYEGKGKEVFKQLEELLDKGCFVLVQAVKQRVPFSSSFVSYDVVLENPELIHPFLVVGYDEKRLFYVDSPFSIKTESFIHLEGNKSIGVVDKKGMEPAFDYTVRLVVLYPEALDRNESYDSAISTIKETITSYYKSPSYNFV